MHNATPETILTVESFALESARTHGRGLVVIAVDGPLAQLVFVPLASWVADPLPAYADDARLTDLLRSYDPTCQYVVLEGVRNGEEMILQPYCLPYILLESTPRAVYVSTV